MTDNTGQPHSLVQFYRQHGFNPVPIPIEEADRWQAHLRRRRNLYENHLGIPLSLLKGRSVIEFGCNSGENGLVLALYGAELTLVEPNQTVWPRLRDLFGRMGLTDRIKTITNSEIDSYETDDRFDLVIAEGFVNTLPSRDSLIGKLLQLTRPGGRVSISFDDRYGCLLECFKQWLHYHCCEREGIADRYSAPAIGLAERLFGAGYQRINASRPFLAWVQDSLVNPWLRGDILWSFPEIIPLVEQAGGQVQATSPLWSDHHHFQWYKNAATATDFHQGLLQAWKTRGFGYFLTGLANHNLPAPTDQFIEWTAALVQEWSDTTLGRANPAGHQDIAPLIDYLASGYDPALADELLRCWQAAVQPGTSADFIIQTWQNSPTLNTLWGCPYHYLAFSNERS